VLGTGIDLDTAQGISVLTGADSAAGISVAARVAADATAGPRTLVLKVGVEQAAATGSVVVMPRAPAVSRLYFPYLRSSSGEYTGIAIANPDRTRPAVTRIFARDQYGALLWNPEATVPADVTLPGGAQSARLGMEVFRFPAGVPQEGSVTIESDSTVLQGFCLTGDFGNTRLDGAEAFTRGYRELYFPDVLQDSVMDTEIHLMNTGGFAQPVDLVLATGNGEIMLHRVIPRGGKIGETVAKLFGFRGELHSAYVKASAPDAVLAGFQLVRQPDAVFGLNALPPEGGGATLFAPQFAVGDLGLHLETRLNLVNAGSAEAAVTVEVLDENGRPLVPASWNGALAAGGQAAVDVGRACGIEQGQGYIRVSAPEGARLIGNVVYGDGDPTARGLQFSAALPLFSAGARNFLFSHVAQGEGYYTGIALLASQGARTTVEVCDREGRTRGSVVLELAPGQRLVSLLSALLPETAGQMYGYIRVTSDRPVMGFELFGTSDGRLLSAVPPQRLPE
jgi:hypothetical protein